MVDLVTSSINCFDTYYNSFLDLSESHKQNFIIKKEHSFRVADMAVLLSQNLNLTEEEKKFVFPMGLYHDIGRFKQLLEFDTFNDSKSIDHADYSAKILSEENFFDEERSKLVEVVLLAIQLHNKYVLPKTLSEQELLFSKLLRDADKLDILKVLTDYYSNKNAKPNHTLTWELPKKTNVSPKVARQILDGKLVSKADVVSEIDVKVMQMSWVYDLNFRASYQYLLEKMFLKNIYNSLPKNDLIIEIYRTVKIFAENKLLG